MTWLSQIKFYYNGTTLPSLLLDCLVAFNQQSSVRDISGSALSCAGAGDGPAGGAVWRGGGEPCRLSSTARVRRDLELALKCDRLPENWDRESEPESQESEQQADGSDSQSGEDIDIDQLSGVYTSRRRC